MTHISTLKNQRKLPLQAKEPRNLKKGNKNTKINEKETTNYKDSPLQV